MPVECRDFGIAGARQQPRDTRAIADAPGVGRQPGPDIRQAAADRRGQLALLLDVIFGAFLGNAKTNVDSLRLEDLVEVNGDFIAVERIAEYEVHHY